MTTTFDCCHSKETIHLLQEKRVFLQTLLYDFYRYKKCRLSDTSLEVRGPIVLVFSNV
jgi:hypothetical protein